MEYGVPLLQKAGIKLGSVGKAAGKKVLGTVAKELLGGYLKWKAAELAYKGVASFVRSRKKKKNREDSL